MSRSVSLAVIGTLAALLAAWTPLATEDDPLIRMPGTQPQESQTLESTSTCLFCHGDYDQQVEPGFNWKGGMMAQAARDPLFWAAMVVAGQDSIWAIGRPNAMDLCERCHFPKGWLEGRSDPVNASAMTGADFDGVQCDFCHALYDPFFAATHAGAREGKDWTGYWDETGKGSTPSQQAADETRAADSAEAETVKRFNGSAFFASDAPASPTYGEAAGGQYYVSFTAAKRGPFADSSGPMHEVRYSRFHKSRYFCATCHDVSNPVLANLAQADTVPGDGKTVLASEEKAAYAYFHVERTFSEFALSAYGKPGGAAGVGPFAPKSFDTSLPGDLIGRCQDCHMRALSGKGARQKVAVDRPAGSVEHPNTGQPRHDMAGGNVWVTQILASAVPGSTVFDQTNADLLGQGPKVLTLDLAQGNGLSVPALLEGVKRAREQLELAASIDDLSYDAASGQLAFKVQNQTGHKLPSGFPEGRRIFVNVRVLDGAGKLLEQINPYDDTAGTLRGLDPQYSPESPALGAAEKHEQRLIYEMQPSSTLTGEDKTFHFVLADGRYKDNRIPPKGFDVAGAAKRLVTPVWAGKEDPGYYTAQEYAGGHDAIELTVPKGAERVEVSLYYQVTSREYVAFLRDEIKGTGKQTLPAGAYVIQQDPFFAQLKAWGETIWQLWEHNKDLPGAAPVLMTQAVFGPGAPAPDAGPGDAAPVADAGVEPDSAAADSGSSDAAPRDGLATADAGADEDRGGGCGCAVSDPPGWTSLWLLLLLGAACRRRRQG